MAFSVPDYVFSSFKEVTPAFLKQKGIRCLLSDIDNTLVTYDDEKPTEAVAAWLAAMKEAGITVIFLSNNTAERVSLFAEDLDNRWYAPGGKPMKKTAMRALKENNFTPQETAVLGDQVFTDVWTGNFLKAALTLFVPPIKDKTNLFFKTKRLLEKPFLAHYRRRDKKRMKKDGEN